MEKKKKVGRPAKFVVRLTPEERTRLEGMIRCGKGAARVLMNLYRPSKLQCCGKIYRSLDETT